MCSFYKHKITKENYIFVEFSRVQYFVAEHIMNTSYSVNLMIWKATEWHSDNSFVLNLQKCDGFHGNYQIDN